MSVTRKGRDGMEGRRKEDKKCLPDNLDVQLCIRGGEEEEEEEKGERAAGWRCWAEERGANALRRERRRRAYSYCSCPPVNKGLIWVRM